MFIVKISKNSTLVKGYEKAGNAILNTFKEAKINEKGKIADLTLFDLEEIHLDNSKQDYSNELIYGNSLEAFETKPKTIFLGGDHSLTYSTARAFLEFCKRQKKQACFIIFDSNIDCSGNLKELDNKNWLKKFCEEGGNKNILIVGIRKLTSEEIAFLNKNKIQRIGISQIIEDIDNIADTIMEFGNGREVYLSIDINILDPVFAPGNSSEIGGLTSRQLIYLLQRINNIKSLRAVDIVEINPNFDKDDLTVKTGAKILEELL